MKAKCFKKAGYLLILIIFVEQLSAQTGNTFQGTGAGASNTGNPGSYNSGFGYYSLNLNSTQDYNTGVGAYSLYVLDSAQYNTAIGYQSSYKDVFGNYTTGVGAQVLYNNTSGSRLEAVGYRALYSNTTGTNNVAVGDSSLYSNTTNNYSTAVGSLSMPNNTAADNNAFGYQSLYNNTTGTPNSAFGALALETNTTGSWNVGIGNKALYSNSTASYNTAVGGQALYANSTASYNTAVGFEALYTSTSANCTAIGFASLLTTTGPGNTATGSNSARLLTTGVYNTVNGAYALYNETTGSDNVAIGYYALEQQTGGYNSNTAVGYYAGEAESEYSDCTFLGYEADASANNLTNATALGYGASVGASNTIVLGNSSVTALKCNTQTITALSDIRFKKNVADETHGLDFVMQLKPITYNIDVRKLNNFTYGSKADSLFKGSMWDENINAKEHILYSGFSAQQVEQAAQKSGYDFSGVVKPAGPHDTYGLSYSDFVVPIVKAIQEQQTIITNQAATIQKQQDALNEALSKLSTLTTQLQDIQDCCNNREGGTGANTTFPLQPTSLPSLLHAVPNPTSQSSSIFYSIPASTTSARIELLDNNGVVLQRLPIGNFGSSSISIPTGNLASGTYYYSLIVNDQKIDTKKLEVVR